MTTAAKDAVLLGRVADGDHEAFTEVMKAHENRVFSVCLRIMGDREKALDATQETFLTAFRKAHQFEGKSTFATWVATDKENPDGIVALLGGERNAARRGAFG